MSQFSLLRFPVYNKWNGIPEQKSARDVKYGISHVKGSTKLGFQFNETARIKGTSLNEAWFKPVRFQLRVLLLTASS
jgi:hypothetical protein